MKKTILLLLLTLSILGAQAQTTYQLNYDSIRVGKTTGLGGTSLYGKVYLKNVGLGSNTDSILTVVNGRIKKVARAGFQDAITLSAIGASPNANGGTLSSGTLTLQPASNDFGGIVTSGNQDIYGIKTIRRNGASFIDFKNNTLPSATVKGAVGLLGSPEMNVSFNMDYSNTGLHRPYDSTYGAVWTAYGNGGAYIQYANANAGSGDIWANTGRKYLQSIDTLGRHGFNSNDSIPFGSGLLYINRHSDLPSISGGGQAGGLSADSLIMEGGRVKGVSAPVYLNKYNDGMVHAPWITLRSGSTGITMKAPLVGSGGYHNWLTSAGVERGYIGYATSLSSNFDLLNSENGLMRIGTNNATVLSMNGTASTFSGSVTASSLVKSGGTSSQFLKADGSVDATAYGTGTVTSVTGTANQITVTGTTTPVISLPSTINGLTSVTSTGFTGALTGNASTATALQTARTIGGVSFDGTANITVASATGGFTNSGGALTSQRNGEVLVLQATTVGGGAYIQSKTSAGAGRWYLGNAASSSSNVTLLNEENGDLRLGTNGTVSQTISAAGDATFTGNISAANLTSGTYTPTFTVVSNVTGSVTGNGDFMYTRVGNTVHVQGSMAWTSTSSGSGSFRISLPVASNFTSSGDGTGLGSSTNSNTNQHALLGDATNDAMLFSFNSTGSGVLSQSFISFMYQVK